MISNAELERPSIQTVPAPQVLPRNCTFSRDDWDILASCWHPVARIADIGDRPVPVKLLDQEIVLYRTAGGITAAADVCAHRGAPLSLGRLCGQYITCPYHGYSYDSTGRCARIPAHPDAPIPSKLHLRVFRSVERYGLLWVCLDPSSTREIPPFPEFSAPGFQVVIVPPFSWTASAGRQLESFCDVAHFAFVHEGTFAVASPVVPRYDVEPTDYGLYADFESKVGNVSDPNAADQTWRRIYEIHVPFTARLVIHYPGQGRLVILNTSSPVSARKTQLFAVVAREFDHDKPVEELIAFQQRIYGEDQAIVERQNPEDLPLDLSEEVHVRADLTSVVYRRQLAQLGLGRLFTS
jgi:vanillate O-demethylase monooxygenase subunit